MQQQLSGTAVESAELKQSERFWAQYWHQMWRRSPAVARARATAHLCAYLQESCYWASANVTVRFTTVQCTLADGFQIAITCLERILKGYNPDYGSNLQVYARNAFGNVIRDQLRQQQEVNICSDWGLLRRLSQTQLTQSLLAAGLTDATPTVLVWQCFKAICTPDPKKSTRGLPTPSPAQLAQMTERYNQLRYQLSPVPDAIDAQTVLAKLRQSVKAARAYLTPTVTSLNQPQYDDASKESLDDLSLAAGETPMEQLLTIEAYAERQQYVQQLERVLEQAIAALEPPSQALLALYYQQTLTQKEIAAHLNIKQYQVSRKLSRIRQQLLLSIAQWSQESLHISMESAVLASISELIHEWLQRRYRPELLKEPE
ncbi:MAG: sigma-70 family RNA polymerase sigma factor [Leptolyngbya sp. SIO1E4]|nr:sigma-70 family RNA polymerase sigma factor [Leptolyngbya sp. SIO1E4]